MKKILLIIIILVGGWYGYTHYKHQGLSVVQSLKNTVSSFKFDEQTKCISKDGKTYYGLVPQGIKCEKKIKIEGAITILPNNNSSDLEKQHSEGNHDTSTFECDGRKHCSQMISCLEAFFFLNNCPNTKLDGDNDGIPCEQQWCN